MRIKRALFWAIIADETTDRHHREQLAVVIRYVLSDEVTGTWRCYEDPVAVIDIYADIKSSTDGTSENEVRLSGEHIGDALLRMVGVLGLVLRTCVLQVPCPANASVQRSDFRS